MFSFYYLKGFFLHFRIWPGEDEEPEEPDNGVDGTDLSLTEARGADHCQELGSVMSTRDGHGVLNRRELMA